MPKTASGAWLSSARTSSFILPRLWECVRSRALATATSAGKIRRARCGGDAAGLHAPFEDGETDDERHKDAVEQDFRILERDPETAGAERPRFGIASQRKETGRGKKDQRPVSRPRECSLREKSEKADGQNDQAGPVMVVLGPGFFGGRVGARSGLAGNEGGGGECACVEGFHLGGVNVFGKVLDGGAGEAWEIAARGERRFPDVETRSVFRSMAGGREVSEAAVRMTVMPMPISASPKRFRLAMTAPPEGECAI